MSGKNILKKLRKRARKPLLGVLVALGAFLALCALLLAALPSLASTDFVRTRLVAEIARATGKPARLDTLSLGWTDGLRLRGLVVGHGALTDPAFLLRLDDLHATLALWPALRGDFRAGLTLRGLRLHMPPSTEPTKPLPVLLRTVFSGLDAALKPIPLPLDAHLRADLADMDVRLEPKAGEGGKPMELRGANLRLTAEGLKTAPVRMAAGATLWADGRAVAPLSLNAELSRLIDTSGRVNLGWAALSANAEFPGATLTVSGGLASTLKADLRADLPKLADTARPLAPLPGLDGKLAAALTLTRPEPRRLNAGLVVFIDGLRATVPGKNAAGAKRFGPLSLSLLQEARLDLDGRSAVLPGSLDLRQGGAARWEARLSGIETNTPQAGLAVSNLRMDLGALLPALSGALPKGLRLGSGKLELAGLDATADIVGPDRRPGVTARLRGLSASLGGLSRAGGGKTLRLDRAALRVDEASATLPGGAKNSTPAGSARAALSASVSGLRQSGGGQNVALESAGVTRAEVRADGVSRDPAALFGLAGALALKAEARADGLDLRTDKATAAIAAIHAAADMRAELPHAKSATAALTSLEISAPSVRVTPTGKKTMTTPLALRASAPSIVLGAEAAHGGLPDVRGLTASLDLGRALGAKLAADLNAAGVRTSGSARIDAGGLFALAAPLLPAGAGASGSLAADWRVNAALPRAVAKTVTTTGAAGIAQNLRRLSFLRETEATLRLNDLGVRWPRTGETGAPLVLRGLSTPRPLRLQTQNGAQRTSLTGSLAFGPLDELPGAGRLAKPLRGLLTLNAASQGLRSVQLSEALHLDGPGLDQNLTLAADRLDKLLDGGDPLAATLSGVDARATFSLAAGDIGAALRNTPGGKTAVPSGLTGKGALSAKADVQLAGGRFLSLSARLASPGVDLSLGPDLAVTGLRSDVSLSRRFALTPDLRCPGDAPAADPTPLSEQVFGVLPEDATGIPATGTIAATEAGSIGALLRPAGQGAGGGTIAVKRLRMKAGGLPLDVRDIAVRLDDGGPTPGVRSFRAGLLGGSVLGRALLRQQAGGYGIDADMAFSGIDPGRLLPAGAPRDSGANAEASGRVRVAAPLTADAETLLRRLTLRADITHIGPRTLERLLYALDPQEQNETIVQQRRLMGMGYPRFLRVAAAYGNLSLSGAVTVKGFDLDLPRVDRLAIANLPIRDKLAGPLSRVPELVRLLDAAGGTRICRDRRGAAKSGPGALRVVQQKQGASR